MALNPTENDEDVTFYKAADYCSNLNGTLIHENQIHDVSILYELNLHTLHTTYIASGKNFYWSYCESCQVKYKISVVVHCGRWGL